MLIGDRRKWELEMKKSIIYLSVIFLIHATFSDAAVKDTSFRFSTIESEHFSIHFHQGLDDLAQKAALIAEEIHGPLTLQFNWTPREKTQMVLIDNTDFTNGFATVLPYNTIYIQTMPPSIDMTLGEYEDWLRMLIVHEYSHILTMDAARGYSEVMRGIFGKPLPPYDPISFLFFLAVAPPNVFLPSWWHEGMATWGETEFTSVGRGRSTFYEMILRMAVAENNIPTIDQINGEVPYWPDGSMPYIFGLRLQKYIADRYGKEALAKLNTTHAGRFPYFINGATIQLFGKRYPEIYRDMIADLRMEQSKRSDALRQAPFTPVKRLDIDGEKLTNPRYSSDGSLIAFNRRDPHGHEAIWISRSDGADAREVVRRLPSDHAICWSPDGSRIYFSQAEINRGFNIYQDLYAYDLKKERLERLTSGLRIKEADISSDGRKFAVILNERGNQNLAILEIEGNRHRLTKLTEYQQMHLSGPRWSPDGGYIAYAVKDNKGKSGIHIYNMAEKSDISLFENSNINAYATWSPDGRYIIYSSDETKVYNLFAWSITEGKRYQITHLLGGAFQPDISAQGKEMVFSVYGSKGFKTAVIKYNPEGWMTLPGPAIEPYWKESIDSPPPLNPIPQGEGRYLPKPYSAVPTLLPHFWLPAFSGDHKGTVVGAFTAGQDVLGYNTYLAQIGYGTSSDNVYYDINYLNDYAYPTLILQAYERPVVYSGLLPRGDYYELNRSLVLGMSVPINSIESKYRFTLGYHMIDLDKLNIPLSGGNLLFAGRKDNLFAGVEFSNSLKYPYSISHEEGRRISLLHRYYSKETGSDLDSREYIGSYAEYIKLPTDYLRHHVAYISLTGAASQGDRTLQGAFQIGGPPSANQTGYPLRGYRPGFAVGQYLATGTVEYRVPLKYIFQGTGTRPFFYDRLHGALFADAGEVWDDNTAFTSDRMKVGAGVEARLDMTLGYWLRITPTLGVAKGLNQGGETMVYFTVYTNL